MPIPDPVGFKVKVYSSSSAFVNVPLFIQFPIINPISVISQHPVGAFRFELHDDVQLFPSVTVTVYVPAPNPVIVTPLPPLLQVYVRVPVPPLPDAVTLPPFGDAHVGCTGVQVTVGGVKELATVTEHVFVHPVVELVTVTVYVPAFNPVIVAVVPPLLHKYVTPVAVAVALPFGVEQFVLSTLEQVTVGGVVVFVTIAEQVFVHEVTVFVTVTVYVPAFKPVIVAVVAPVLHIYVGLLAFVDTVA